MKQTLTVILSILITVTISAQDCNCPEQFTFAKETITTNYSGYKDKVTSENRIEYEAFTAHYEQLTSETKVDSTCFRLCHEWTRWFKDGHIQMGNNSNLTDEEIRAFQHYTVV